MADAWNASGLGVDTRPPDIPLSAAMVTEAFCTRPATPSPALHQRHLVDDTHQPRARTVFVEDPERKCMRQALEREHTVIGWPRSFEAPQARLISHVQQYIPLCVVRDTRPATSVAGPSLHGTIPKWDAATLQRAQRGRKTAC